MIIETYNINIIKVYEFYKFLKYYNSYLNNWSDKNDLDNLEKSYKILFNNTEILYKLNCAKGWGQRNIYNVNQYVLDYINQNLYDEYKRQYKIVNSISMQIEHYNIVFYDYIIHKNSSNKLCLKKNIFKSYMRHLKRYIIRKDYTDKLIKQMEENNKDYNFEIIWED